MEKKKINFGIIGTGHIGNYHIQQALNIKIINFVGVFDIISKQANKIAKKYKIKAFNSIDELLDKCDAVSIASPAQTHYMIAKQALKHSCHLFIEKPITTNVEEAQKIIEIANRLNLKVQVGHIERFNPIIVDFTQQYNKVSPLFIESHRLAPFNIRGTDTNVILDLMIHDIDLILFFVNSEIKKVEASGVSVLSDSFDLVNARLSFQNGCIANLTASRISDKPLRKLRLFEKNQYVSMDLQTNTGSIYNVLNSQKASPKGSILKLKNKHILLKKLVAKPSNALFEELVSFINSIQNAKTPTVSAVDGKKAIELAILIKDKINEQKK
tara:strand:- start:1448 stop:2428 length:981 start_codon:yes stop_codon:yes gene_type:complete